MSNQLAQRHLSQLIRSLMAVPPLLLPTVPHAAVSKVAGYGQLPFQFEANRGQADASVGFLARGPGYGLFLKPGEATLSLHASAPAAKPDKKPDPLARVQAPQVGKSAAIRMSLVGANDKATLAGEAELPGKVNYLRGNDPKAWKTEIPTYAKVKASGVYAGVDLVYYGNPQQLEYDFIVAPGADPKQIRWRFEGLDSAKGAKPTVDKQGDLVLKTEGGDLRLHKPVVYQTVNGERKPVTGRFVVGDASLVSFEVGKYDPKRELVIDPVLVYSTYLGGNGEDIGWAIAVDGAGQAYVTGRTFSTDFPTANTLDTTLNGSYDAFVAKINASGSALIYATYLGGSKIDEGRGIAVDGSGQAYVAGRTFSTDFPTANALDATYSGGGAYGGDAFVAKLTPDGSALVYSTYLGGSGDDYGSGIAVDGAGQAYVTGDTTSTDFPIANALDATYSGGGEFGGDVFVAKLTPAGSALAYATYLGGSGDDYGIGIAVDGAGQAYVTGSAGSTDFPTANALDATHNGNDDAFVAKLNPDGSALAYATYLGGSDSDYGTGIAVDGAGQAYVAGSTSSTDFPTANALDATYNGGSVYGGDAFVAKINASGSALVYATYLGGSKADDGRSIAVDGAGQAYVAGDTSSTNFPTANALDATLTGGTDAFVAKLNSAGSALAYATYLGGSDDEDGAVIAVDGAGQAYVAGETWSTDFPTANALDATLTGGTDAFIAKIGETNAPLASADLSLKVTAPKSAKLSKTVAYSLVVGNESKKTAAPAVIVTAQLPDSAAYTQVPAFCGATGPALTCQLNDLAAKKRKAFTVKTKPGEKGKSSFTASVTGNVSDPKPANNTATVSTTVK